MWWHSAIGISSAETQSFGRFYFGSGIPGIPRSQQRLHSRWIFVLRSFSRLACILPCHLCVLITGLPPDPVTVFDAVRPWRHLRIGSTFAPSPFYELSRAQGDPSDLISEKCLVLVHNLHQRTRSQRIVGWSWMPDVKPPNWDDLHFAKCALGIFRAWKFFNSGLKNWNCGGLSRPMSRLQVSSGGCSITSIVLLRFEASNSKVDCNRAVNKFLQTRRQESNTRTTSARRLDSAEVWIALEILWSFVWGFCIWLIAMDTIVWCR